MPTILNPFPSLLMYVFFAPLILRLVVAFVFLDFGMAKLTTEKTSKAKFFDKLGLKPGKTFVVVFAAIEVVTAVLLLIGLYTQIAALIAAVILLATIIIKTKDPASLASPTRYYAILLVISVSLLLTGAGAYALDTPL